MNVSKPLTDIQPYTPRNGLAVECPICYEQTTNLVETTCQPVKHVFCYPCLKAECSIRPRCPFDRNLLDQRIFAPTFMEKLKTRSISILRNEAIGSSILFLSIVLTLWIGFKALCAMDLVKNPEDLCPYI